MPQRVRVNAELELSLDAQSGDLGMPSVHPLQGDEMRARRELKRSADSPFVFVSERGAPFTRAGFTKMS
jgi:hypothetical protein